ncbi:MAG: DUF1294 domain-containing protein [Intestinimonas sp.]|nr:DUF1294 domain-containing protein [Intestinimonas sp.]
MIPFLCRHWGALGVLILGMSTLAFCAMGVDKWKARRGAWRVPERTLWLLALLLGGMGAWLGMRVFRHKTLHREFRVGFSLLALAQLALLAWCSPLLSAQMLKIFSNG